jgi:MYXO-CTERM domain-containing protein
MIELVQTIPVLHRDGDWIDWAADTIAAALVLGLAALLRRRFAWG